MATRCISNMTREELEQLTIQLLIHDTSITADRVSYDFETGEIAVHADPLKEADRILEDTVAED